ncbi:MAG: PilN domain-containing protein [Candidatus Omnitrophica bacterium]|nr:PilN domain-containing protein [Candidatus Omnitrophota bacterium]
MIEINLLPEELKLKTKKKISFDFSSIDQKKIIYLVPVVFGVLILIHIYLAGLTIVQGVRLGSLNKQWVKLEPERKKLEFFQKESNISSADSQLLQQLNVQRVNWAEKLDSLSTNLPSGIWLEEILISDKAFSLRGSIISLAKEEMNLVNKFIENLKNDSKFFKDFNSLELGSINRRQIKSYDIMDFILEGNIKSK